MPRTTTYKCDKCAKTETVAIESNGITKRPENNWVIVKTECFIHGPNRSLYPYRGYAEPGCLCFDCAKRIGIVASPPPQPPSFEEILRDYIGEAVEEKLES